MKYLWQLITLLTLTTLLFINPSQAQDFPDVCLQPENVLPNCTFDAGLQGWQPFTELGAADFSVLQGGGECHAPLCPAAYIVVEDHFIGGIYQQVSVTPGTNYYANIVWLVFDSLANDAAINSATGGIGRRIGVDPLGGTDSGSPNVVWAPDNWRNDCKICNIEQVTVTAQAETITVFLRLDDTWKLRAREKGYPIPPSRDKFWIDDMGLKPVSGDAILTEALPTDTPVPPPTDTPPPPTDTPPPAELEVTEESEATEVVQVDTSDSETEPTEATTEPTQTPLPAPPTLTPTNTPPPQPTPTVTETRSPTETETETSTPTAVSDLPLTLSGTGTVICIGSVVLIIAAIILAGLVMLYRAGWSNLDDDDLVDDFSIVPSPGESTPNNTPSVEPDSVESTATDENNKIENNSENE